MTLDDELCMGGKINHFNNNHFSDLISKLLLTSIVDHLGALAFVSIDEITSCNMSSDL